MGEMVMIGGDLCLRGTCCAGEEITRPALFIVLHGVAQNRQFRFSATTRGLAYHLESFYNSTYAGRSKLSSTERKLLRAVERVTSRTNGKRHGSSFRQNTRRPLFDTSFVILLVDTPKFTNLCKTSRLGP